MVPTNEWGQRDEFRQQLDHFDELEQRGRGEWPAVVRRGGHLALVREGGPVMQGVEEIATVIAGEPGAGEARAVADGAAEVGEGDPVVLVSTPDAAPVRGTRRPRRGHAKTVRTPILRALGPDGAMLEFWVTRKRDELRAVEIRQVMPDGAEIEVLRLYRPAVIAEVAPIVAHIEEVARTATGPVLGGRVWVQAMVAARLRVERHLAEQGSLHETLASLLEPGEAKAVIGDAG